MKKKIAILGSTGSIGKTLLKIIEQDKKNFNVVLLSANKDHKTLLKQAEKFNVKNLIITNEKSYRILKKKNKKKIIKVFNSFNNIKKILNKKIDYAMSSIVGIEGLDPTYKIIKHTKRIAIANKETIICGWSIINKELRKYNTEFIPVDSEHFSLWYGLKNLDYRSIEYVYLTASGGPFYKVPLQNFKNINVKKALKHPNWKMGKKISIDSATLMNKIFELIEAKKIFNLDINKFKIIIHPKSYVHAIVHFNNGLVKILAHDTNMSIPIMNSLYENKTFQYNSKSLNISMLNNLNFSKPNKKKFPVIKLINMLSKKNTYFETILITINDYLVDKYLNGEINYNSLNYGLIKLIKNRYFTRYYKFGPKNITDVKIMVKRVTTYLNKIKLNEN